MDWGGWAVFGLVATALLTVVLLGAQLGGYTRLDLPLMLGSAVVAEPDGARVAGLGLHVLFGQGFAVFYAAGFASVGAGWWRGALFGSVHALVALIVLVPLLPSLHPRMATERAGPASVAVLEPPGLFALNYGASTPLVTFAAHVAYGVVLGLTLQST